MESSFPPSKQSFFSEEDRSITQKYMKNSRNIEQKCRMASMLH